MKQIPAHIKDLWKYRSLDNIGSNSVLDERDAEYLKICSERLYSSGHYTKSIYLDKMLQHAKIKKAKKRKWWIFC